MVGTRIGNELFGGHYLPCRVKHMPLAEKRRHTNLRGKRGD